MGIVAATIANTSRGKRSTPYHWNDFVYDWSKPEKQAQAPEDQLRMIEQINTMFGGLDLRKNKPPSA